MTTPTQTTMPYTTFMALPNHPLWTEKGRYDDRVGKKKSHPQLTGKMSQTQLAVATVEFNNEVYKLDGHSRSCGWRDMAETDETLKKKGRGLELPTTPLLVTQYKVESQEDLNEIFKQFDSKSAADTLAQTYRYAINSSELVFKSPLLKETLFTNILKSVAKSPDVNTETDDNGKLLIQTTDIDIYKATEILKPALLLLDSLNLEKAITKKTATEQEVIKSRMVASGAVGGYLKFLMVNKLKKGDEFDGDYFVSFIDALINNTEYKEFRCKISKQIEQNVYTGSQVSEFVSAIYTQLTLMEAIKSQK